MIAAITTESGHVMRFEFKTKELAQAYIDHVLAANPTRKLTGKVEEAAAGEEATAICDKWVAKLGYGFHPDTRGAHYDPPLTPAEVKDYDADIMRLFDLDLDPYLYAVAAMEAWAQGEAKP